MADQIYTSFDSPNFFGDIFEIGGKSRTPLLNMLRSRGVKTINGWEFSEGQSWSLEASYQLGITENASIAGPPESVIYVKTPHTNTVQIFQYRVKVGDIKRAMSGWVKVDTTTNFGTVGQPLSMEDALVLARREKLLQAATDLEWHYIFSTYVKTTGEAVAAQMGGLIEGAVTNDVTRTADMRKDVNDLMKKMADNGCPFQMPVLLCGSSDKQVITKEFGVAPMDRNVGGMNIQEVETDFARLPIVYIPKLTNKILVVDLAYVQPVVCPIPGKGVMYFEPLAKNGAAEVEHLFGLVGLDRGPESLCLGIIQV